MKTIIKIIVNYQFNFKNQFAISPIKDLSLLGVYWVKDFNILLSPCDFQCINKRDATVVIFLNWNIELL